MTGITSNRAGETVIIGGKEFQIARDLGNSEEWRARKRKAKHREADHNWKKNNPEAVREYRDAWKKNNPDAVKKHEKRRSQNDYHRPFVVIDSEGMEIIGDDIAIPHSLTNADGTPLTMIQGAPLPAETVWSDHRTILWGAKGWQRKYSAVELADAEKAGTPLPRTVGSVTPEYWLGDANKRPLTSLEILEWLTSLPGKFGPANGFPDGVNFVMFGGSYDATQILKDLSYPKVWEITRRKYWSDKKTEVREATLCGEYAIKYLKGKFIEIWKLRDPEHPRKMVKDAWGVPRKRGLDTIAYIKIMDTFGFYQSSFVNAIRSLVKLGYITQDEFDLIESTKLQRSKFDETPFDKIKEYCGLELDALSKALTVLRDGFDQMGFSLREWTGAGAAAGAFIRAKKIAAHYSPDIVAENPSIQQQRAHLAYVGGRIELVMQGYAPDRQLFNYDIASAYPAALAKLPSMTSGTWEHGRAIAPDDVTEDDCMLSMFRVRWKFPKRDSNWRDIPFYPFAYRTKVKGGIIFPSEGHAWVMRDDVLAAKEWFAVFFPGVEPDQGFKIEEYSRFTPGNGERPYDFLPDLYKDRKALKREGNIMEKAIKLTINSLYGKTVQAVGEKGKPPSCACPYYGAAVTSYCRARLLRAALHDSHAVVSFMTDGIVTTRELKDLPRVKAEDADNVQLGDWEIKTLKGGFFMLSGMYALIEMDGKAKTKTRGYNPHSLVLRKDILDFYTEDMLNAWKSPLFYGTAADGLPDMKFPAVSFITNRYMTAGEACASSERFKLIGRWAKVPRSIDSVSPGVKRSLDNHLDFPRAYISAPDVKLPSRAQIEAAAKKLDIPTKDALACLKAGEALRCRFLIPTTPALNDTPDKLSEPSIPDWFNGEPKPGEIGEGWFACREDVEAIAETGAVLAGMC